MKRFFTSVVSLLVLLSGTGCGDLRESQPLISTADYEEYFDEINGCAVFYDYDKNSYKVYNEEQLNTPYSPYSTFKIIAALEGLKTGVLENENSTMNYNGGKYPFESWEKNLNLKEAFQNSCVWYFRQVIDGIGQENMKNALNKLKYGNCDVSEWMGNGEAPTEDTNGFWLGSSLEITPIETVNVLADVFEGKSCYTEKEIYIVKDIMKSDVEGVYGKTGTGRDNSAWYVGFYEDEGDRTYFAVHLDNGEGKSVAGADAKDIACKLISINK